MAQHRIEMMRRAALALFAGVVAAAMPLAASAQDNTPTDPRLHTPGQLTVGTGDPVYPPWMLNNDPAGGEGFENGLVYALAAEMGFTPEQVVWVGQTFDQAIAPGAKPYDFSIQQISVTEARAQIVSFSQVYFQPQKAVIALPGTAAESATSFEDLRSLRWGAVIGTTDNDYLVNILGVTDAAIYNEQVDVFQALQAGQIDATIAALPTALFVTAVQVPDAAIVALLPADANDRGHGLLFEFGNPLVSWVDEALSAIIERGVVDDLIATYLVADPDLPIITE
ncbi:substrate-binding periplasmic protein [Roseicyclus mahoneyensis]|uniref:Amino acid ABC transporter substrate-binding protein (PAAT family) n=1 Tax=Roseicyclus mahoneyensis TaxID=164332 RepID=A0A316GM03_9RHOB|nr:transporter substrate-binding domain-containing protein [Roseicyclus mahoneyensis]PWK62217.1 amino acid ABC transporter substrate-binding protein (PAAT family) [Roseicyclus mahoneyensis]